MTKIVNARVKNRLGNEAAWLADDPILLKGEIALVLMGDLLKFKIGTDDTHHFSEYDYNVFDPTNFAGLAQASTDPGTPVAPVMYILKPGVTYAHFKDNTNTPITVPTTVGGNPVVTAFAIVDGAVTTTVYNTAVISLIEYPKFTDIFKVTPHTETAVTEIVNEYPLTNVNGGQAPQYINPQNTAITRNSGAVELYNHDEGYPVGTASSSSTWATNNYMFVNWKNATPGFLKDGMLTELRIGVTANGVTGSKLQAFILRPVSLGAGTFTLVSALGELPAEVNNTQWHVFRGLSVQVKAGDMVGIRGINCCPVFFTGFPNAANYTHIIASFASTAITALNSGITVPDLIQAPTTGRVFQIQAKITNADPVADNVPGGKIRLSSEGYIPRRIGKKADMQFKGKTLIWIGTSIPAQNDVNSYPTQIGQNLDCKMNNESVGSSGICWDGLRALSLSAKISELTALFPGYEPNSYENKIIGKSPDLLIFDHGHNDMNYPAGYIIKTGTGVYNSTNGSAVITGTGTKFLTDFLPGDKLIAFNGSIIGYVLSIASDTSLTLTANVGYTTPSGFAFSILNMNRVTFFGAANYIIQKSLEAYPSMRLIFFTPFNKYTTSGAAQPAIEIMRQNILSLAAFYNAPVCDMMKLAGVNINNFGSSTIDGTHPTQTMIDKIALIGTKAISDITTGTTQGDFETYLANLTALLILPWTAKAYPSGAKVNYLGIDWVSNAVTLSTDIPGTSTKWIRRVNSYTETETDALLASYVKTVSFGDLTDIEALKAGGTLVQQGTLLSGNPADSVNSSYKFNSVLSKCTLTGYVTEITFNLTNPGTINFAIGTTDGTNFTVRKQLPTITGVAGLNTVSYNEPISINEVLAIGFAATGVNTATINFDTAGGPSGNNYTQQKATGAASNGANTSYYAYGYKASTLPRKSKLYDVFVSIANGDARYVQLANLSALILSNLGTILNSPSSATDTLGTTLSGNAGNDSVNSPLYRFNNPLSMATKTGSITEINIYLAVAGTLQFAIGSLSGVDFAKRKVITNPATSTTTFTGVVGLNTFTLSEPITNGEFLVLNNGTGTAKVNYGNNGPTTNHFEQRRDTSTTGGVSGPGLYYAFYYKITYTINPTDILLRADNLNAALATFNATIQTETTPLLQGVATDNTGELTGLTANEYLTVTDILPYDALVKNIGLNVGTAGNVTFAIGLIDQNFKVVVEREFVIACIVGVNSIAVSQSMKAGQQIFIKAPTLNIRYKALAGKKYYRSSAPGYTSGLSLVSDNYLSFTYTAYKINEHAVPSIAQFNAVKANVDALLIKPPVITDDVTGSKYRLVVRSGVLSIQPSYARMLVLGNSITKHPITSYWWGLWGMAASIRAKDFCHLMETRLLQDNPSFSGDYQNGSAWELNHDTFNYTTWDGLFSTVPDLVIIRLVENVSTGFGTLQADYAAMITYIRSKAPNAKIIATGSFWVSSTKDAAISAAAAAQGVTFVPLSQLDTAPNKSFIGAQVYGDDLAWHSVDNSGVAIHPGDLGHQNIANALLAAIGL